jgi:peptidoglycan/xylan/chitin deacetylase (PgdA/CDA1 family)
MGGVPVIGFVNEDKLEIDGVRAAGTRGDARRLARCRPCMLGNHTYGHVDLHVVGIPAFEDAILRGERVLRPMLAKRGQTPQWFRHPYLRAGSHCRGQGDA